MKKIANIVGILLSLVLLAGIVLGIVFAVRLTTPGQTEQPKQPEPHPIYVNYRLDGKAAAISDYLECDLPAEATAGETVTFTAKSKSESYTIERVSYLYKSLWTGEFLTPTNGVYSFVMPDEYVQITIYCKTVTE